MISTPAYQLKSLWPGKVLRSGPSELRCAYALQTETQLRLYIHIQVPQPRCPNLQDLPRLSPRRHPQTIPPVPQVLQHPQMMSPQGLQGPLARLLMLPKPIQLQELSQALTAGTAQLNTVSRACSTNMLALLTSQCSPAILGSMLHQSMSW